MEALYADTSIEEKRFIDAFTLVLLRIVFSTDTASFTVKGSPIVEGTCIAFDASLVVEVGFFWGTDRAGVFTEIIKGMFGTGSTLLSVEIEVFGQIALNALRVCEEGFLLRTFTTVLL